MKDKSMNNNTEGMSIEERVEYYEMLLREKDALFALKAKDGDYSRARSYTIGSTGGGSVEITLRGLDSNILFYILQPVEVSELIHTLAASIGCYAALKPREDFASFRNWHLSKQERERLLLDPESYYSTIKAGALGLEHNENGTINKAQEKVPTSNE